MMHFKKMTSVVCNSEGQSETYTYANAYFKEDSGTLPKDPLKVVINGSPVNA